MFNGISVWTNKLIIPVSSVQVSAIMRIFVLEEILPEAFSLDRKFFY